MTALAWVLVVAVVVLGLVEVAAFVASKRKKQASEAKKVQAARQHTMSVVHVGPTILTLFAIGRNELPPKVQAEVAEHLQECRRCTLFVREVRHPVT